jgi:hypothetical protein
VKSRQAPSVYGNLEIAVETMVLCVLSGLKSATYLNIGAAIGDSIARNNNSVSLGQNVRGGAR